MKKSEASLTSVGSLDQAEAQLASNSIGNCLMTIPLGGAGACIFYLPQAGKNSGVLLPGEFGRTGK